MFSWTCLEASCASREEAAETGGSRHQPRAFLSVDPNPEMMGVFWMREPRTLYGVFKVANEGTGSVYWADDGVASLVSFEAWRLGDAR